MISDLSVQNNCISIQTKYEIYKAISVALKRRVVGLSHRYRLESRLGLTQYGLLPEKL